jgi:RNA polymerase sigma-32 factor
LAALPHPTKPKDAAKKPGRGRKAERAADMPRQAEADEERAAGADDGETGSGDGGDDSELQEQGGAGVDADGEPEEAVDEDGSEGDDADREGSQDSEHTSRGSGSEAGESASIERFDALQAYLREVQRHPLLTPEQTHALSVKFIQSQDPAAAAQLVTSNLRLVVKIAYEYRRAYRNIMDLIQEGNIGLMQAVKRYDPYRGVKLSSYAAWWIRAYILRFILNNWRLVKLGTTQAQRKLFFNLRKKRAELQAMGIDPTNAEIAKQLNVPESEVADMDVRLQATEKSLDAPVGDAEGRSIAKVDMMPSSVEGPESLMADGELQALLKEKLGDFRKTLVGKDKELAIFDERLIADEPLTLQELGDRFGISRERVRQLEQRLTGRLRDYLREEMGDAVEVA